MGLRDGDSLANLEKLKELRSTDLGVEAVAADVELFYGKIVDVYEINDGPAGPYGATVLTEQGHRLELSFDGLGKGFKWLNSPGRQPAGAPPAEATLAARRQSLDPPQVFTR